VTTTHAKVLHVFDFDGTLVAVNSFRQIAKDLLEALWRQGRLKVLAGLIGRFLLRKMGLISHLDFKAHVMAVFEASFDESKKQQFVEALIDRHGNHRLFELLESAEDAVVSTASPFSIARRVSWPSEVLLICALDPRASWPCPGNIGEGKVQNLKAAFRGEPFRVVAFYTDDEKVDRPMIDLAEQAYLCRGEDLVRIK